MELNLPEGFVQRMRQQLGDEANAFMQAMNLPSPTSIRLHHLKGKSSFPLQEQVKWCDTGYYLESRPSFHLDPHWHGGAYYVQEASSMILDEVLRQLQFPVTARIWLDMCAAPGGKTGILAKYMAHGDVLIANEVVAQRRSILRENLVKGGYINTFLTGKHPSSFPASFADVILIDAPCAGEGMMRKEPEAIRQWSPKLVSSCSILQQNIVRDAVHALKPGGILIYSTCSYSPDENIGNVSSFLQQYPLDNYPLHFQKEWNIETLTFREGVGYQLYPHHVRGEGLFIAVMQKRFSDEKEFQKKEKTNQNFRPIPSMFADYFSHPEKLVLQNKDINHPVISQEANALANEVVEALPGIELISAAGEIKGKDFIPSHFLSMSDHISSAVQLIPLEIDSALDFLERKIPNALPDMPNGWHLVTFDGTRLGWLKNTSQGWKNHYPMNWRLRHRT